MLKTITATGIGKKSIDVISTWTTEEVLEAYKESLERALTKSFPIGVKAKMDSMGILTISFTAPVSIPSYLLREFSAP